MTARYTRPAPFSARPVYVCPTCGRTMPTGGWQRQYDYDDHLAAHRFWSTVRAEAVAVATWPLLLAVALWAALTGPRRHEDWTLPLAALVFAVCAVMAILCSPWGRP